MGTIIKRCSVSKILHIKESNAGAFTVCFFTSNLKGQAQSFPENIQTYGATAYFKVSSQHLPAKLLEKMSFDLEGHFAFCHTCLFPNDLQGQKTSSQGVLREDVGKTL